MPRFQRFSKELPPGHIGHRLAQEAIDKEYGACREIELQFSKAWKKQGKDMFLKTYQEIADFSANLTRSIGTKPIRRVCPKEPGKPENWAAYYRDRVIYTPEFVSVVVIVHETAHHVCRVESIQGAFLLPHGQAFCEIESLLFQSLLTNS